MSKEATIIQSFNDFKRQYEYFVKGYDVTESVKILLKRHKEEYDKEKNIFAGINGYLEAQKEYQSQLADLEAKLAEKDKEIEIVKHERNANGASYMSACKMLTKERQDKISFAVEKLNYLQDIIDDRVDEYLKSHDMDNYDCFVTHQGMYSCFKILVEEIDNQINELKGEK